MSVKEFVSQSGELLESDPSMGEETTKFRIIAPFLELAGWDTRGTEVKPEYPLSIGTSTTHADFALMGENSVKVLVEIKSANSRIKNKEIEQLKSYMRQEISVEYGLITDGKQYKLFTKNRDNSEEELLDFDLEDLEENPEYLSILKKENIKTGKSEEIEQKIRNIRDSKSNLKEEEEKVVQEIINVLNSRLETSEVDLGEKARGIVQEIITELGEKDLTDEFEEPQEDNVEDNKKKKENKKKTNEEDDKGFKISVNFEDNTEVFHSNTQIKTLLDTIECLIEKTDMEEKLSPMPYVPEGKNKAVINEKPVSPHSGEEMKRYREISNGWFLTTVLSKEDKIDLVEDLNEIVEPEVKVPE